MPHKDPEKRREYSARWYAENKERKAETDQKYRAENKERIAETRRRWNAGNKERMVAALMIARARASAVKKRIPFDVGGRRAEIEGILLNGGCHYTGLPFNLEGGRTWDSPSLDRVVPELGYVWSNVRVVLDCVNGFKGTTTLEKICFVAEHLLEWQAAKTSVLLPDPQ